MSSNGHLQNPVIRPIRVLAVIGAACVVAACAPASRDSGGVSRAPTAMVQRPAATPTTATPTTTLPPTYVTSTPRLGVAGCELFPRDHAFAASIGTLPVKAVSDRTIAAMGPSTTIMAGFGSTVWDGSRPGYPINVLDSRTVQRHQLVVSFAYSETSTTEGVPWPTASLPRFEGWPGRAWDKHLLVVDPATCSSFESINMQAPGENPWATLYSRWYADKVVKLDLSSNTIPVQGSVTASGTSMLAGLVRYDEVASGRIDHVLTMPYPTVHEGPGIWPSRGTDGRSSDPDAPPMGTWLRLKAGTDISGLGPQAKVVAQAMKDHGVVIIDSGPNAAITGEPDERWNDGDLAGLRGLTAGQFEVVDPTPMKVSDDSYRIR